MTQILKVISKDDAGFICCAKQAYEVADNRERGWDGVYVHELGREYAKARHKCGLTLEEAEIVCWYVWQCEDEGRDLPDLIQVSKVQRCYKETYNV